MAMHLQLTCRMLHPSREEYSIGFPKPTVLDFIKFTMKSINIYNTNHVCYEIFFS
jgi:hypothetical protein